MSKEEELRNWSDDDEEEEEEIEEEVTKDSEEGAAVAAAAPAAAAAAPGATSPSSSPAFGRPSGRGRFQPNRGEGRRFPKKPHEYTKYPIPDEPPFTARVSHLPLEMKARELQDFFENTLKCKVEKVTTRFDGEHVKKGTFDVIFEDKQSLEIAIGYDRKSIQDTTANIYVPPPHDPNRPPRQSYGRGYHRGGFRGRHYDRRNNFHHDRAAEGEHKEGAAEGEKPAEAVEVKKEGEEKQKPAEAVEGQQQQEGEKKEEEAEKQPLSKAQQAKLEKKKKEEEYKAKREEKKKKKKAAAAAAALKAGDKKKTPAKPTNIYDLLDDEDDEVDQE